MSYDLKARKLRRGKNIWLPILSTLALYVVFTLILQYFFDIDLERNRWVATDFVVSLLVSYLIFGVSRSNVGFLLIQLFIFSFLFIGHALKIGAFGGPMTPDDLFAFTALFNILMGWQFWLLLISFSLAAVVLLYNFNIFSLSGFLTTAVIAGLIYGLVLFPGVVARNLDKMGYVVWSQRMNYVAHGPFLYSLHETARFLNAQEAAPTKDAVRLAYNTLNAMVSPDPMRPLELSRPQRNVHIILLESFWDPTLLKTAEFSEDPFVPGFRALWKQSGNSSILSPVYGGYTANAEFELLCGFPVEEDAVKFERRLKNNVPCLPRILNELGYISYASHPNTASFWNRLNAYQRIGFTRSFFINDYEKIDMAQDEFMGDSTYYAQTFKLLDTAKKALKFEDQNRPIFNYMVTIFGHLPYPLTEDRPKVVTVNNASETVEAYANNMYYKSKEFMEMLAQLQKDDPDALIIAFGDHLPNLGQNFAGYSDAGFLTANKSEFTNLMLKNSTMTPLLIIDGQNGVENVGNIALYQLPELILKYLGLPENGIMRLNKNPQDMVIRPLPGQILQSVNNHEMTVCRAPAECPNIEKWMDNMRVIAIDLFQGHQYILNIIK